MEYERVLEELYSSNFTTFLGNYGRGKSISLTYLSIASALLNKRKIVMSNMPIFNLSAYGLEFIPLISSSQFNEGMRDVQIVLDEIQKVANSRKSLSPENSFVTEFSTDVRKFNQGITATSQFNNTYDVRLSDNTEVNILPTWITNEKKDRQDFNIRWDIFFIDSMETESINLSLDCIKELYDTTFKPFKFIINHEEYIESLTTSHKESYVEKFLEKTNKNIKKYSEVFDLYMKERW